MRYYRSTTVSRSSQMAACFRIAVGLFFCPILKYICELVLSVNSLESDFHPWQCTSV
jgi:hypothetical protein